MEGYSPQSVRRIRALISATFRAATRRLARELAKVLWWKPPVWWGYRMSDGASPLLLVVPLPTERGRVAPPLGGQTL